MVFSIVSHAMQAKQFLRNEYRRGNVSLSMEDGLQKILTQNPVEWPKDSPQQHYMDFYKWILEEYEVNSFS